MKKGLVALGALLALGLTACTGNNPAAADKVAPEITGNSDKVCTVDEEINLLTGIKALDDVDGDISSNVTVTILPELTVTNGKVTPNKTGDYEVQYSVTDKAGNKGEAFATLTVNPKLAEKTEYIKYTFGDASDSPFSVWKFEGLDVASSITKGNYEVKGKSDGEAWHIKYEGKTPTVKGADYEVTYEFVSNVSGNVTFEAYDISANKTVAIEKGFNKVSFKFSAAETKEEQGFCLQLGALPTDFEIAVSHVEIAQSIGQDVWASQLDNFKFNGTNTVTSAFDNNSQGSLATTETSATLNITRGSDENGVWQTKMFVKTGVDLLKNVKYRVLVDVLAENDINEFEICYNQGDVEKGVGALYGQSVAAGVKKTIEFIVTPDQAKDNLVLLFQLGKQNELHGANTVTVSNLVVEKIVTEDEDVVDNHTFTESNLANHFWSNSTGTFVPSADGTKAVMNITKAPESHGVWEVWGVLGLGTSLEKNRTYKFSVDVLSTVNTGEMEALLRTFNEEDTKGGQYGIKLSANQTTHVEFEVNLTEAMANPAITFQMGVIDSASVIEFSNLKVVALGGSKETTSTGYSFTPDGFGTYNDAQTAEGYLYSEDGKLVYEMTKIGLTDWFNKLYISRLRLEADKIYTISFTAKADKNISCAFFLNPVGKWDPRVSEEVQFTTELKTFEYVTPKFAADMDFEVLWQFGSDVNQKLGGAKIEITSIIIYAQDVE